MKLKKIITVFCAALLITSAFASCNKNSEDNFNENPASVDIVDSTEGNEDSTDNADANADANSQASEGEVVVTYDPASEYKDLPTVSATMQKSTANIQTTYFAADETSFYYIDNNDEAIYKVAKDGSGTAEKICDQKVSTVDINSDGKLDYTINKEDGMDSNSFTMNKDGSGVVDNHQLILDYLGPTEFKGPDGKIYANLGENDGLDESGIYVRASGAKVEDATLIKAGFIDSFCLVDNYLVISISGMDGTSVYRCGLDGSNMVKLFDANARKLCSVGNTVYFINETDNNYIYEISVDAIKNAK